MKYFFFFSFIFDSCYPYKRNERIIGYFGNFEDYLDEDAMWQISETIKPRGGKKTTNTWYKDKDNGKQNPK